MATEEGARAFTDTAKEAVAKAEQVAMDAKEQAVEFIESHAGGKPPSVAK